MSESQPQEPSFEELVAELDKLVGQLESGQLSLEDSLAAFERGMHLSRKAGAILDAAEARIEQLTGTPEAPQTRPFEPPT
jgi:exodeoxyribonuclease VII small subunit